MNDNECVRFLQWALPRLQLRWPGFRKVRAQVCKRIDRRMRQLDLENSQAYRNYLQEHDQEWAVLDELCRITISRFYRDKLMFGFLAGQVLPALASQALDRRDNQLSVWSAGCASGEEAYTLSLIWHLQLQAGFPDLALTITATDACAETIARARQACYPYSSIKNLPPPWQDQAFSAHEDVYCLKTEFRQSVLFLQQDIRKEMPTGNFDLVLCRNLAFTYFEIPLQCSVLEQMQQALKPGGVLIIGVHETLPSCARRFSAWSERLKIFRA